MMFKMPTGSPHVDDTERHALSRCECPAGEAAHLCGRHGVVKTGVDRLRCRQLPFFWRQWEAQNAGGRPGSELHELLQALGVEMPAECPCRDRIQQMDVWGAEGCRAKRAEIVEWLRESQREAGWLATLQAGLSAIRQPWFRALDPLGSIVNEAIRRAEEKRSS